MCGECGQPIAALINDLKQGGLLDETLIIWSGDFGRASVVEAPKLGTNACKINGRDHNHCGFTTWLCRGRVKGGHIHGAPNELGFKDTVDPVPVHAFQATIMRLLGMDHECFAFRYAGWDFRLTEVHRKAAVSHIA